MQACETREKIMDEIGKELEDYTEDEAKRLMTHYLNCLVCRRETKKATEIVAKYLLACERGELIVLPLAKILPFKPRKKEKTKRPSN